jgi:hypothetical protein
MYACMRGLIADQAPSVVTLPSHHVQWTAVWHFRTAVANACMHVV